MDLLAINGVSSLEELLTQKNNVLIGGNGSGKSRALECIFQENIKTISSEGDDEQQPSRKKYIVCFSSGQNERFSTKYKRYITHTETADLNCFFYNKEWSKLLIFLATTQIRGGKTRKFLLDNNYIQLTPDIPDDLKDDTTSTLEIGFRVQGNYVAQIQAALEKEESGEEKKTIRTSAFHQILENFIYKITMETNYSFDYTLWKRIITLNSEKLNVVSFDQMAQESQNTRSLTIPIVSFFTQAAVSDKFIIKSGAKLYFKNPNSNERLEIDELSDGEYQLLFLYALIDLFDTPNTTFLLDEIDAHIHYKNIHKLWEIINAIQGKCIITTHLIDSITQAGIENIYTVEKGKIEQGKQTEELKNRLAELSNLKNATLKSYSLYPKIVLIDDLNDWEIFKRLAIKKLADNETAKEHIKQQLENILCIKKPSNYDGKSLAIAKTMWLENFINFAKVHSVNTQSIYLICDRDDLPLTQIKDSLHYIIPDEHPHKNLIKKQANDIGIKASVLVWRRREIKHYLLSYTALLNQRNNLPDNGNLLDEINNKIAPLAQLKQNNPADYVEKANLRTSITEKKYNQLVANLDSDDVKGLFRDLINTTMGDAIECGLDLEKLQAYIDLIPPEEISEDIEKMYNFIVGNS